jgi:hypothetical protein
MDIKYVPRINHITLKNHYRVVSSLMLLFVSMILLPWSLSSQAQNQISCSSPSFGATTNFEAGSIASAIAVGDYNRDGAPDLAVANAGSIDVSILLGDGHGGFGPKTDFPLTEALQSGVGPGRITEGDFNRDGKLDLAVPNEGGGSVVILMGDGLGGFSRLPNVRIRTAPFMPAVGDFNLDGKPDLAVTARGTNSVAVMLGDGTGRFGTPSYVGPTGSNTNALGVGDFNRDGKPDLAVGHQSLDMPGMTDTRSLSILLGDGTGGFGAPTHFTLGIRPQSMSIADFNRDGVSDIAVSIEAGADGHISVLLGDGVGGFGSKTTFPVGTGARGTGVADFNSDGKLDFVVALQDASFNKVAVLLGDGQGSFSERTYFPVGDAPRKIAVGDFNCDGKPDVAVPNTSSNNVSILLNTCAP